MREGTVERDQSRCLRRDLSFHWNVLSPCRNCENVHRARPQWQQPRCNILKLEGINCRGIVCKVYNLRECLGKTTLFIELVSYVSHQCSMLVNLSVINYYVEITVRSYLINRNLTEYQVETLTGDQQICWKVNTKCWVKPNVLACLQPRHQLRMSCQDVSFGNQIK